MEMGLWACCKITLLLCLLCLCHLSVVGEASSFLRPSTRTLYGEHGQDGESHGHDDGRDHRDDGRDEHDGEDRDRRDEQEGEERDRRDEQEGEDREHRDEYDGERDSAEDRREGDEFEEGGDRENDRENRDEAEDNHNERNESEEGYNGESGGEESRNDSEERDGESYERENNHEHEDREGDERDYDEQEREEHKEYDREEYEHREEYDREREETGNVIPNPSLMPTPWAVDLDIHVKVGEEEVIQFKHIFFFLFGAAVVFFLLRDPKKKGATFCEQLKRRCKRFLDDDGVADRQQGSNPHGPLERTAQGYRYIEMDTSSTHGASHEENSRHSTDQSYYCASPHSKVDPATGRKRDPFP